MPQVSGRTEVVFNSMSVLCRLWEPTPRVMGRVRLQLPSSARACVAREAYTAWVPSGRVQGCWEAYTAWAESKREALASLQSIHMA